MYLEYLGDVVQAAQWKVFESESSEEQWHLLSLLTTGLSYLRLADVG